MIVFFLSTELSGCKVIWRLKGSKSGRLAGPGVWNVNTTETIHHARQPGKGPYNELLSTTKQYSIVSSTSDPIISLTLQYLLKLAYHPAPAAHHRSISYELHPRKGKTPPSSSHLIIGDHRATPSILGVLARAGDGAPFGKAASWIEV